MSARWNDVTYRFADAVDFANSSTVEWTLGLSIEERKPSRDLQREVTARCLGELKWALEMLAHLKADKKMRRRWAKKGILRKSAGSP
jgi:hypothetical protein